MRRLYVILIVGLASLALLGGCSRSDYKKISKKQLRDLMIELYVADGHFANIYDPNLTDSVREAVYTNLFAKYGTTRRDYDSTLMWYGRHDLEEYIAICQSVRDELEKQRIDLDKQIAMERENKGMAMLDGSFYQLDSVNMLSGDSACFYRPNMPFLNRSFVITPPIAYNGGTRLEFVTRLRGLQLPPDATMEMYLQLVCADNTTLTVRRPVNSGLNMLTTSVPDSASVSRVYGYLRGLPDSMGILSLSPFVIDSFSLRKFEH
ncbi:DUF4296 domain-containing protein [Porphyromonas gulae]|uniref:DUF4296 domain-containing protein n=1 Tax=Porphyromonas gulae TaxID=111105 RepID=UPI0026F16DBF|nr:DUF4296 domain-containing protein [Porphyromonas gulae]